MTDIRSEDVRRHWVGIIGNNIIYRCQDVFRNERDNAGRYVDLILGERVTVSTLITERGVVNYGRFNLKSS